MNNYLFLMIVFCAACSEDKKKPEPRVRPVKYFVVGSDTGSSGASQLAAQLQSRDATTLSFRIGGTINQLNVKLGDDVKRGQVLATLDPSDLDVALAQARANLQSAKSQRDAAESSFKRVESLYESNAVSLADYESAKAQRAATRASYNAAAQQVKAAKNQRSYASLAAPFAGKINELAIKSQQAVSPGQKVAVLSKAGTLEVKVGVPAAMLPQIRSGQKATVTVATLGKQFNALVSEVGFAPEGGDYPVILSLETIDPQLRPGMAAAVTFDISSGAPRLMVPLAALQNKAGQDFVFALTGSEPLLKAKKTVVSIGELSDTSAEILDGLSRGDKIATAGVDKLIDGMTVRLWQPRKNND